MMGKSFVDLNLITFAVMEVIYLFGGALLGIIIGRSSLYAKMDKHVLHSIISKLNTIMATQAQHAQDLRDLKAQNEKARLEVLAKIAALEEALANSGNTTPEVDEALADLKASVQTDDDIVPDAPPA